MIRSSEAAAVEPQRGQRMIFTGPGGVGDYRPRSNYFPGYIGIGATSPQATSDLSYLFRSAPHGPSPGPKHSHVGEVGWGWQYNQLLNREALHSNMQIKKAELQATLEDRVTQTFQN
ncbi:uncharacterized protein C4orf45 [Thalassophryne amazonica]|uniref:uncharacterized protein C4orf45 n=1 Tax=Thalassophryne amazonica TaxID=390379 RepID=UPI00147087B6|nr:uncharacterized protein C4orf45 [Thalassophryne amazonica]